MASISSSSTSVCRWSGLKDPIRRILTAETDEEQVAMDAVTRRGRRVTCHVKAEPLRASDGNINGVILIASVEGP